MRHGCLLYKQGDVVNAQMKWLKITAAQCCSAAANKAHMASRSAISRQTNATRSIARQHMRMLSLQVLLEAS